MKENDAKSYTSTKLNKEYQKIITEQINKQQVRIGREVITINDLRPVEKEI